MTVLEAQVRRGTYHDSVVLMQLQRSLSEWPGVLDSGVVMGTPANKAALARIELLAPDAEAAGPDDLVVVVRTQDAETARAALAAVDSLLNRRQAVVEQEFLPKGLDTALQLLPDARWALISVAGRYAADVARDALHQGRNVFLFSDNVALEDEISLKRDASERGLLVMGPDCGTAIINGVGLGFANRVRRGSIGIVAASGTGLQQVSCRIHQLGGGVSHALGTGGRDLSEEVGGITARQALDLLDRDSETQIIVLVSKPAAPTVADDLLRTARLIGKQVVVDFIGHGTATRRLDNLHYAGTFDEAAALAVQLAGELPCDRGEASPHLERFALGQRYLRGLFSGGTLAYEALSILQDYLPEVFSNAPLEKGRHQLDNSLVSQENTVVDLGADEFTVGRLHPMMDNDLRVRRLKQEADDPAVAIILLDVVLGYGAHPNPASELAPAIVRARAAAQANGRCVEVVAVMVGTDEDPQGFDDQVRQLQEAGARVECSSERAARYVGRLVSGLEQRTAGQPAGCALPEVDLAVLREPLAVVNIGLEVFAQSLKAQGARVIHVDWRPPAGGDERLMSILRRMKRC